MPRLVSQIPIVDWDNPDGWLKDDITGLPIMHRDSVKQMQYGANGLFWTGFMVQTSKMDQPNPQMMPPHLRPEMIPIPNRRQFNYPQLPGVPTNVAGGPSATPEAIDVTWSPVQYALSYVVECYNNFTVFVFDNILSPSYTITDLIGNAEYNVSVASVNSNGQSAFTTPISLISSSS